MSPFFEELKRRKVYRVTAAYVVAAGGIIQLASAAFPAWELPNWALRLVIVLLLIGFPIALILAWAFDVTPEGIRATEPVPNLTTGQRGRRNIALLAVLALVISATAGFFLLPRASANKLEKSIAVLPFQNFSDDKANAYFADGIQDDILTNLSKVSDLKVISRTSVMGYREKRDSVRDIGKALGVSTILEGSVRRSGNQVRVNVQLIDATNDKHIWAEDYDGDLTDVFKIQSDLARQIADALQARLSPNEKERMTRKPTENGEAYLAFVEARNLFSPDDVEKMKQAEQLYQRATTLDPKFGLAFAYYSFLESWLYHGIDPSSARRILARTLANKAMELQPDLPEAHLALGYCYYYGDLDYDRALKEFEIAQRGLPNNSEALLSLGAIQRRMGKWEESIASLEKASKLNPKDVWPLQNLALTYAAVRNYSAADEIYTRGLALDPHSMGLKALRAQMLIAWKGDLSYSEKILADLPPQFDLQGAAEGRVGILIYQRKFTEALELLQKSADENIHGQNGVLLPKTFLEGICYLKIAPEKSQAAFERARIFFQQKIAENPENAEYHAHLGEVCAVLNRKEEAIREGKRAVELLPESKDAFDGPMMTSSLAQIYAWVGENEQALALLDHLLTVPAGLTVPLLKLDFAWDPLRKDPRFQALLDKYGAKS